MRSNAMKSTTRGIIVDKMVAKWPNEPVKWLRNATLGLSVKSKVGIQRQENMENKTMAFWPRPKRLVLLSRMYAFTVIDYPS